MKIECLRAYILSMAAGGISVLVTGCVVYPNGTVGIQPLIVAPAPVVVAPAPVETVTVPDDYVWDGVEYVGVVGGAYFYLGPGNVWLACDPIRVERFHGWERGHPDWHNHAIHNDRYRRDAHGHEQPRGHDRRDDHH
jgi:hypothetical protein